MTVAPPRISLAPAQPAPPPVPEVARTGTLPVPAPQGEPPVRRSTTAGPGSSLVDSTAHLFATPDAPLVRRYSPPGGSAMSAPAQPGQPGQPGQPVIRRHYGSSGSSGDMSSGSVGEISESIVDQVVERLERRVLEELERRGRRQGRGGF